MPAPRSTSLIDLVDQADHVIGRVPRGRVFTTRAGFRVTHIFVFNSTGDLLLQRLGEERRRNPLRWGSSVAAYLHAGESTSACAHRRLREELGLATTLQKFGSIAMHDQGCIKFITLYLTKADRPSIEEPEHIQEIQFRNPLEVLSQIKAAPQTFTETFRHVFRFYWSCRGLLGAGHEF